MEGANEPAEVGSELLDGVELGVDDGPIDTDG